MPYNRVRQPRQTFFWAIIYKNPIETNIHLQACQSQSIRQEMFISHKTVYILFSYMSLLPINMQQALQMLYRIHLRFHKSINIVSLQSKESSVNTSIIFVNSQPIVIFQFWKEAYNQAQLILLFVYWVIKSLIMMEKALQTIHRFILIRSLETYLL